MAQVRTLVCCANGLVGRAVVEQFLAAGFPVRALVRNVSAASNLARCGADVVGGDFSDPASLARACQEVDAVFYQLPAGLDHATAQQWALSGLEVISRTNVKTLIYHPGTQSPRAVVELPSFQKDKLESRVRGGSWTWAIIRPTFMLQNLLLPYVTYPIQLQDSIVYPVASDVRLSWVAAEDVGRVAARLLADGGSGYEINLGSSERLDGSGLATAFTVALGRPITFVSLPLDDFEKGVDAALGEGIGRRVSAIFRFIQKHPDDLDFVSRTYRPTSVLDGFWPMDVTDWVRLHREAFSIRVIA